MNNNKDIELTEEQMKMLDIDALDNATGGGGVEIAHFLDGSTVVIHAKSDVHGILLEPVTAKTLADAINDQLGVRVNESRIVLKKDIRTIGTYNFQVNVAVRVVSEMKAFVR